MLTETPASPDGQQYHGAIHLFIPEAGSIHSTQVTDIINGPHGEVLVATAFGLSTYNGSLEHTACQPEQYLRRPDG